MSFHVYFKERRFSKRLTIGYNEFKELIKQGKIHPKCLVKDPVLTRNQWWHVDELNVFHKHSPTQYQLGPRLQERHDYESYWRERWRQSWKMPAEYIRGTLIDERYKLVALSDLIKEVHVFGLTRLYVLRSFEPERIFTLTFGSDGLSIEVAQGRTSLWHSLPQVSSENGVYQELCGRPFNADEIHRLAVHLAYEDAPEPFKRFSTVEAASLSAPSCSTQTLDGVGFRHRVISPTGELYAEWRNPNKTDHVTQTSLILAYYDCVVTANLGRFWEGREPT